MWPILSKEKRKKLIPKAKKFFQSFQVHKIQNCCKSTFKNVHILIDDEANLLLSRIQLFTCTIYPKFQSRKELMKRT